jgi:hypothetical protein
VGDFVVFEDPFGLPWMVRGLAEARQSLFKSSHILMGSFGAFVIECAWFVTHPLLAADGAA